MVTALFKYGALATAAHYVGMTVAKPIYKAYGREMGVNPYVKRFSDATFGRIAENIDYYARNREVEKFVSQLTKSTNTDCVNPILYNNKIGQEAENSIRKILRRKLNLTLKRSSWFHPNQNIESFEPVKKDLENLIIEKGNGRWFTGNVKAGFEKVFWTLPNALADRTESFVKAAYSQAMENTASISKRFKSLFGKESRAQG